VSIHYIKKQKNEEIDIADWIKRWSEILWGCCKNWW